MLPTQRFSSRVADYRKYRPDYPTGIVTDLTRDGILTRESAVADVGSGTGLLTQLFLRNANPVFAVEPNPDMRAAGEEELHSFPRLTSINGTAEATTLAPSSIDLITVGQAFHWFDRAKAKQEFIRILRPAGWCALIWNDRKVDVSPFLVAYEQLLQTYSLDYASVDHRRMTPEIIAEFFHPHIATHRTYENRQVFNFESLRGRLLSSSYAPPPGHPQHEPMLALLTTIFKDPQQNGKVAFEYETEVYTGRLTLPDP